MGGVSQEYVKLPPHRASSFFLQGETEYFLYDFQFTEHQERKSAPSIMGRRVSVSD